MNLRLRSRFVLVTFTRKMHGQSDSPKESAMALAALKRKPDLHPQPELKTYHVAVIVTRAEERCVEAESPEEARELLAAGLGHRCHLGERIQFEVESLECE
jgi:hypothetical protein